MLTAADLQINDEALNCEGSLKAERVKLLSHREKTLQNTGGGGPCVKNPFEFIKQDIDMKCFTCDRNAPPTSESWGNNHIPLAHSAGLCGELTSFPFVPLMYFFSFSCCKIQIFYWSDTNTHLDIFPYCNCPVWINNLWSYQVSKLHWEAAVWIVLNVHNFSVVGQDEKLTASMIK